MKMSMPWQLQIYRKSFKKKEKVHVIDEYIGPLKGKSCLEIGCDKGVTSYFLRKKGGWWVHADIDYENVNITKTLIGASLVHIGEESLPFLDASFDCVVAIDTLEHIEADTLFLEEIHRVLKANGTLYITVPCSEKRLILNRISKKIGMTKEYYGHKRDGYTIRSLNELFEKTGFNVSRYDYFSKFFTEGIELAINFIYVFLLNNGLKKKGIKGSISPASQNDFNVHSTAFKLFGLMYPMLQLIIKTGALFHLSLGYCLIVEAGKTP